MTKLLKVVKVEMREKTTETVRKSKRHDYVRGGYRIVETILRETSAAPYALLECGHWRREHNYGAVVSKADRLSCHECETEEWSRAPAEKDALNAGETGFAARKDEK